MTLNVYLVTPGGARGRGGIGRVVGYLERGWQAQGSGAALHIVDSYGPNSRALMPVAFALALLRLVTAALLGRIDLLHLNMAERGSVWRKGILVWMGSLLRIPVVLHCHGAEMVEWSRGLPPLAHGLLVATLARVDRVIVLGSYWRDFMVGELGVAPDRVDVLWNAVPAPGLVHHHHAGSVRLLFLGRLGERKGVPELLAALGDPRLRALPWTAVLAGDGAVERYRNLVASAGMADRIELPGWIDAATAERHLAEADILVLPSHNEGLPMAVLEAMASGLAIVTTPVGAIPDAIRDGDTGLLVPAGDAPALADALYRLITDMELRRQLGQRAHSRFLADFSIEACIDRLSAIYEAALHRRPEGRMRPA
jgi:glycosyltransferase involved in cell wall biosynthesis